MSYESAPFERGATYFGRSPDNATDGGHLLGQEYTFRRGVRETDGTDEAAAGRLLTLRAVRNATGTTGYAKRLGILSADGKSIVGWATQDYQKPVAPVDERLPSGGVASNDICYVAVKGPALCLTQVAEVNDNIIGAGEEVRANTQNIASTVSVTAAETGGRIQQRELTSSVTAAANEQMASFGRAATAAATSGVTDTDILVDLDVKF